MLGEELHFWLSQTFVIWLAEYASRLLKGIRSFTFCHMDVPLLHRLLDKQGTASR